MNIWTNTKILDSYLDCNFIDNKEDAEIILLGGKKINLNEFPKVKGIFRVGVGKDNIPFDDLKDRDIKIMFPEKNTIETIYSETANFTCYMIFRMLYSNIGNIDNWYRKSRKYFQDNKLLIIGNGNIGNLVYNKMKPLLNVDVFDVVENNMEELEDKIKKADCISLHIPYNNENDNFMDKDKLSWMKDGSVLINCSRGKLVDEDSLYRELKNNRLRAAFDVFWEEPYTGKLKELDNDVFYMTPHLASVNSKYFSMASNDFLSFCGSFV